MKKTLMTTALLCLTAVVLCGAGESCDRTVGPYLDQAPPGLTPEIFAPDIVSLDDRYEYSICFSPDGYECVFGVTNMTWGGCDLFYTKMENNVWPAPTAAYFQTMANGWLPFIPHDGSKLFFVSGASNPPQANIGYCEKDGAVWGDYTLMDAPINSNSYDWRPTMTTDGTLYFASNRPGGTGDYDIYRSVPDNGQYLTIENVGPPINTVYTDASPFISPDGDYFLFECWKPGGYGKADIYISYLQPDETWTEPKNLGPVINTNKIDDCGIITTDGEYFFFCRRKAWVTSEQTDIFWVSSKVVFQPYLADPIEDSETHVKFDYAYTLPAETFKDYDDEILTYTATRPNNDPLPAWLNFCETTMTFYGKPSRACQFDVKLTAEDEIGSTASDEFTLTVKKRRKKQAPVGDPIENPW